jgi:hypothetical protein
VVIARLFVVVTFATLYSMWQYLSVGLPPCACFELVEQIAIGTAEPPMVYRILIPKLLYAVGNNAASLIIFQTAMFAVFFMLIVIGCKRWGIATVPTILALLVAITIMMPTFYFGVYTVFEWNLYLCVLLLLPRWSLSQR